MRWLRALIARLRGTPPDPEQRRLGEQVEYEMQTARESRGYTQPVDMDDFRPPR